MKGQMLKLFVVVTVCLAVAAGCMAPPPSPAPTPVPPTATPAPTPLDIVQKYQDAVGRHDVDTAMAMFTDDATYTHDDYFTTGDKTMIRNWLEYVAALNSQTKANDCQTSGSTVTCEWRFVHDCFGADGAIGAGYDMGGTVVFTVKDGKIGEYVFTESLSPEYSQWGDAFFKWLEDSHPMDIVPVVQALRTWKFDRDFGQRLVKFCKEQAASQKPAAAATLAPKQVLLVVGLEQSDDMELMLTEEVAVMVSMLEKTGYEVVVASASGEPITGGTTTLTPDLKLADVKVDDYVGFMFPCLAVDMDLPPPAEAVRIAKEAVAQGKPVAAQNGGVVTLSAAGALNGKQFALLEDPGARMPGGVYKGTGVVQDGNIITSGTCPYMAKMAGLKDGTPELTQKLIDLLAANQK